MSISVLHALESQAVLRIAAQEGNPRNSEGAFVELRDGTILFAYSRYKGTSAHDHGNADIAMIRSKDFGKTWSDPEILVKSISGFGNNLMSISMLRLQNGRICLMYLRKTQLQDRIDCRPELKYSDDEGKNWSEARPIIGPTGYFVVNNDRLIQLKSGRLLVPVALHRWRARPGEKNCWVEQRAIGLVFYSDDNGENWHEAPDWILPAVSNSSAGFQEPGVVELEDGRVMLWARTDLGCQYKAFSYDGGLNWSDLIPAPEFPSPLAPLSIKRDPVAGQLVAVWNDTTPKYGVVPHPHSWGRTPYVMAFSKDSGKTWERHIAFEKEPDSGFCYCAIHFNSDGSFLLGYCSGGRKYKTTVLQDITVRRFIR